MMKGTFIGVLAAGACLSFLSVPRQVSAEPPSGKVTIDGSSTVAPITMATAEMFRSKAPRVRVSVGVSGTGGGFKKFLDERPELRTDINDASRPIKAPEIERAKKLGIEFIELPIAYDGIAVVVHPSNSFCDHLTVEELRRIWSPGSDVTNWRQVRSDFPDLPLKLYGPGTDSGTFDYFTEAVMGKSKSCRSDFTASENDNVLVQGVSGDPGGLGYFGFSYYETNKKKLRLLGISEGKGPAIQPSLETIGNGTYTPLSRPLFLYVNKQVAAQPHVQAFLNFFFDNSKKIVEHPRVNYVALPDELYVTARKRLGIGTTGSIFAEKKVEGAVDLVALYADE